MSENFLGGKCPDALNFTATGRRTEFSFQVHFPVHGQMIDLHKSYKCRSTSMKIDKLQGKMLIIINK